MIVEGVCVAAASDAIREALPLGLQPDLPRSHKGDTVCFGPRETAVEEIPGGDFAAGIHGCAHGEQLRRALGLPAMFIRPHPLHAYRLSDGARHDHGIFGSVVGAQAAVAARGFAVKDLDLALRQSQQIGDPLARVEDSL